jgi:hypothetical protein
MTAAIESQSSRWQYYLNPWWREYHVSFTRLASEECRRVLNESTTRLLGRQVGRSLISSADFTLHRVTFYSNSFKPHAYVRLTAGAVGGTVVKVTLSSARSVQGFMAFWFGFLTLWTLLASPAVFQQGTAGLIFPVEGLGMATFGFLLNAFGRSLGAGDVKFLLRFLKEQLHLEDLPAWAGPIG